MTSDPRSDREAIRAAAATIRHTAAQDQYLGGQHPAAAFSMALVLDELALHIHDLPDSLRTEVAAACRRIATTDARERCTSRISVGGARCIETLGHSGAHRSGGSVWQDD